MLLKNVQPERLESLQSGKFSKKTLTDQVKEMVKGGGRPFTSEYESGLTDAGGYSCCGDLYDCYTKFSDGTSYTVRSKTIIDGTTPGDY